MNFGKLIIGKTIKIAATRFHISKLKCTKFAYSAPQTPLTDLREATSKGRGGNERGWRREGEGMGGRKREGVKGRGGEREALPSLEWRSGYAPVYKHKLQCVRQDFYGKK